MQKKLLSLVLALMLCLGLTVPALAEGTGETADRPIVEAIPHQFWGAGNFSEGLAWVRIEENMAYGHVGFIDKTGEIVIPCVYDEAHDFSDGLAAVMRNDKWGFIDKTGKEVIPFKYDYATTFSEGLAPVQRNDKWGYIDKTGAEIIPCQYNDGCEAGFSEGLAGMKKGGKWGFIDKTGKEVIPFEYDGVLDFSEGLAGVIKNGKYGYIDKTGTEVVPCSYDNNDNFYEGLALIEKNGKYGFIDKTGEEVISCQYKSAGYFTEGLAPVLQDDGWGFIDKTGEVVVPCKYADVWQFSEGFARVMMVFGLKHAWGFIDKAGNEVVPCTPEGTGWYIYAGPVSEGMVCVAHLEPYPNDKTAGHYVSGYLSVVGGEEPSTDANTEVIAKVSNWAKEQVDSAAASGLIADGLGDDYTVNITRAQFAAVSVKLYEAMSGETAPAAGDSPFTDTSAPVIVQAEALGFVGGVGDGRFDPDSPVTREQAAVMLSRVYTKLGGEIPAVDATDFADDDAMGSYAKDAVAFMSGKEIVGGVGNNKFDPKGSASIEQALVIALRMFENLK